MGVNPHFLFSLDRHSKQAGDEGNLTNGIPFFHVMHLPLPVTLSYPCNVFLMISKEKKPEMLYLEMPNSRSIVCLISMLNLHVRFSLSKTGAITIISNNKEQ